MQLYPPLVVTARDPGGSELYRVLYPCLTARAMGYIQLRITDKAVMIPPEVAKTLKADVILLHKCDKPGQVKEIQAYKDLTDSMLVYTIDDWVDKIPKESILHKNANPDSFKEIRRAISRSDRLVVTTDYLANVYGLRKDTYVVPNYLPFSEWQNIYSNPPIKRKSDKPRIGWVGALGHEGDTEILSAIADILGDKVQWVFLDPVIPRGFSKANCEIYPMTMPRNYYSDLFALNLDLALAPLLDNEFNRAKSNLRLLEYSACGYPFLVSKVRPYVHTEGIDENCLLPYDAKVWASRILDKISDMGALAVEGRNNQHWVWENYKLEDHIEEYARIFTRPGELIFKPTPPEIRDDTIDIVITTHNNYSILSRCVESVLANKDLNKTPHELVIVDNGSKNEDILNYLKTLTQAYITYLPKDEGYIYAVNKGIQEHPNRDVITLNSDTVVHGDWIDRLKTNAYTNNRYASVTPISNNATVLSYPDVNGSNLNVDLAAEFDDLAKELNFPPKSLPSAIGFCTFYKRDALDDLGLFDQHAFGRGYGEENDWSMRAIDRGWINVIAGNVYVGHENAATFKAEKQKLSEAATAVINQRWQIYPKMVEEWIRLGPSGSLRMALDLARLKKIPHSRTLYIAHNLGGGIETYVQQKIQEDRDCFVLRPSKENQGVLITQAPSGEYKNLPLIDNVATDLRFLTKFFQEAGVTKISVETVTSYDSTMAVWISSLSKLSGIPYEVTVHDYHFVCPRVKLANGPLNYYCGEPDVDGCNTCIMLNSSPVGHVDIKQWRNMYHEFLLGAKAIYAPSKDVIHRFNKYYPDINIECVPHDDIKPSTSMLQYNDKEFRVAVIGYVGNEKGSIIVEKCAKYCLDHKLPVKFIVFGTLNKYAYGSMVQMIQATENLLITGMYQEAALPATLARYGCHISFFPAMIPETFSYTLSHAIKANLMPVAFDVSGAIAERIIDSKFGKILPFDKHNDIEFIVNSLLECQNDAAQGL